MKYASQRVAHVYFIGALILFVVQVLFGLLAGAVPLLGALGILLHGAVRRTEGRVVHWANRGQK